LITMGLGSRDAAVGGQARQRGSDLGVAAAGAIALRFGRSPAVVFLLAITTSAVARLVS
jgi:hypothetical protein